MVFVKQAALEFNNFGETYALVKAGGVLKNGEREGGVSSNLALEGWGELLT